MKESPEEFPDKLKVELLDVFSDEPLKKSQKNSWKNSARNFSENKTVELAEEFLSNFRTNLWRCFETNCLKNYQRNLRKKKF